MFPEMVDDDTIDSLLTGKIPLNHQKFFKRMSTIVTKEMKQDVKVIFQFVTICLFCAVIKNIQSFHQGGTTEVAFYVCYLMICILIIKEFVSMLELCKNTIELLNSFQGVLIPIIMIFLTVSGNVTIVSVLQPIVVMMIGFISNFSLFVFIPIIMIATVMGMVSNLTELIDISRISELLKKFVLLVIEISLIVFVGVLSLEGSLAANVDGIVSKTSKAIVSSTIPVVGKLIR